MSPANGTEEPSNNDINNLNYGTYYSTNSGNTTALRN